MQQTDVQPSVRHPVLALLSSYDGGNPGSGTAQACNHLAMPSFSADFARLTGRQLALTETAVSSDMAAFFRTIHHWVAAQRKGSSSYAMPLLHLGGDHSIAMGFWSGVLDAMPDQTLGLLWLDAHTTATSPSGHIHGMPVAGLLGLSDAALQGWYPGTRHLQPAQLALLGIRHYESAEQHHLDRSGVRWCSHHGGESATAITHSVVSAYHQLAARCDWVGISLDLDVFDPGEVPGVATPAPRGWPVVAVTEALRQLRGHPQWLGFEIAEYCPPNDQQQRTLKAIMALLRAVYQHPEAGPV